jgi:hypothetical protein
MALKQTTFENTTDGAAVTAANGGTGNDALTVGTTSGTPTAIYTSSNPIHGTRAMRLTAAATQLTRFYYQDTLSNAFSARFGYRPLATPGSSAEICYVIEGTSFAQQVTILHTTTNTIQVKMGTGAFTTISGVTLSLNTAYRFELYGTLNATPTTTNASLTVRVFAGDSTTPLGTFSSTAGDLGTVGIVRVAIGKMQSAGTFDAIFDDFAVNVGSSTPIGPVDTTLTASLSVVPTTGTIPFSVTATGGYSGGAAGATITYTFNWGDGTAVTGPQSSNVATHNYTVAGTFTVTLTIQSS